MLEGTLKIIYSILPARGRDASQPDLALNDPREEASTALEDRLSNIVEREVTEQCLYIKNTIVSFMNFSVQ